MVWTMYLSCSLSSPLIFGIRGKFLWDFICQIKDRHPTFFALNPPKICEIRGRRSVETNRSTLSTLMMNHFP